MRVLVAGATGVIGRQLVPLLTAADHEVIAMSRQPRPVSDPKVSTVAVDALDREAFANAVRAAKPDAVVHLLTAIPDVIHPRKLEQEFAVTNRLRSEATQTLIEAAQEAGCSRVITQGVAFAYDPAGAGREDTGPASEDAPFWRPAPKQWRGSLIALQKLEDLTSKANGLVLRFGHLYGPGTPFAKDGATVKQVQAHKFPIAGAGTATFSFTHTHDAATAVLAALSRPATGALNVVDDDPALLRDWLPALAELLGAKKPSKVPTPMVQLVGGSWAVAYLTRLRGADNARARDVLDWTPRYPSWRQGFAAELTSN
ncbi:MAG: NAD(P)-dependent oxidoreductase [Actinomycetota bacterium]|nr:NAD(P)-dependent oxidoreductase [Actinomycetota bacterium]